MFKNILQNKWDDLAPPVQKHYGLCDGEEIVMKGKLSVRHGKFIKLLMPFIRLTGALVPVEGDGFSVTVSNKRMGHCYYWNRRFEKDGKAYVFKSEMIENCGTVVEFVGLGIGIRMGLKVIDKKLVFEDKGYVIKIGSKLIPIPLNLLMGKAMIEEFEEFGESKDVGMKFIVTHPWFGFAFSYMGYFNIVSSDKD